MKWFHIKILFQVKTLLDKLDVAEQYYASSKMFRIDHPAVGNEDFQARVKCLCMWYNLTEQLRSKIDVLGNVLLGLGASRKLRWPSFMDQNDSVLSDEVPASPIHSRDSSQIDTSALEQQPAHSACKVRFKLTEEEANKSSPSDSTNSTDSGLAQTGNLTPFSVEIYKSACLMQNCEFNPLRTTKLQAQVKTRPLIPKHHLNLPICSRFD